MALKAWLYLLLLVASFFQAVDAQGPTVKVLSVIHLNEVSPRETFNITVTIAFRYPVRFLTDTGLVDDDSLDVLGSSRMYLSGYESRDFTFQVSAPPVDKIWRLRALVRYWDESQWRSSQGWFHDFRVKVTSTREFNVILAFRSWVLVDGIELESDAHGKFSSYLKVGIHTVEAPQVLPMKPGSQLFFASWSDGLKANPRQVFLNRNSTLIAFYKTQFHLTFSSPFGTRAGWVDANTTLGFLFPQTISRGPSAIMGVRITSDHWVGDLRTHDGEELFTVTSSRKVGGDWGYDYSILPLVIALYASLFASLIALLWKLKRARHQFPQH